MAIDYVAAATAVAGGEPAPVAPAAPAAAEPVITPPAAAQSAAPVVDSVTAAAAGAAEPEKAVEPPAKLPDRIAKSFEDLARDKAAFRAEREQFSTGRAKSLEDAATKGDAMALLAAAGIPWSKAAQQVLEGVGAKAKPPTPAEPDERDKRLAALETEVRQRKEEAGRAQVMAKMAARVAADPAKFKYVTAFKAEQQALDFVTHYFNSTGELPGASFDESMEIALEAVEEHYVKESQKWSPLLTSASGVATVPSSKSVVPAVGAVSQQVPKTLTNGHGSGPQSVAAPGAKKAMTSDDYIAAAIEAATAQ